VALSLPPTHAVKIDMSKTARILLKLPIHAVEIDVTKVGDIFSLSQKGCNLKTHPFTENSVKMGVHTFTSGIFPCVSARLTIYVDSGNFPPFGGKVITTVGGDSPRDIDRAGFTIDRSIVKYDSLKLRKYLTTTVGGCTQGRRNAPSMGLARGLQAHRGACLQLRRSVAYVLLVARHRNS